MAVTIADIFNTWNSVGVFSYVLPFLLIFAVVYAILDKSKLLASKSGEGKYVDNKGIMAIISVAVALMSLQFDIVSQFFAVIFPRFGIGLSILLVFIIFIGFFLPSDTEMKNTQWFGWAIVAGIIIWSFVSWGSWTTGGRVGSFFGEYVWAIVVLGIIVGAIVAVTGGFRRSSNG